MGHRKKKTTILSRVLNIVTAQHFLCFFFNKLNHLPTCGSSNLSLYAALMVSVFSLGFKMLNALLCYNNIYTVYGVLQTLVYAV